ncbi:amidase [Mesorhizobium sp. M0520]|uniref:amidase n=1 Tax=unclassified Mesorhizobium TaxID=325217 RepID=UPI003334C082
MTLDTFATVEELAERLIRREISAVELTRAHLERIKTLDQTLKAFCGVDEDAAIGDAMRADALLANGASPSPLCGIPFAIKDIFDQANRRTRAGSNALNDRLPDRSAAAVAKLSEAGMVALGRTHMVEFGFGGWGTNPVQGAPCNPWGTDERLVAGGSSSGSAVAVAAGLAPVALGTDTGGSIRTPASWCGVIGLKTSLGLVSRRGVVPLCPTHDSVGPMARSVRDAALLLEAMLGSDERDRSTLCTPLIKPLEGIEKGIRGLRIGRLGERDLVGVEPDVRGQYERAVADFAKLGAEIQEITLPLSASASLAGGGDIMSVESNALLSHYVEAPGSQVDPVIAERIRRGASISGPAYYRALEQRREAQHDFAEAAANLDAFVTPGSHRTPVPLAAVDQNLPSNQFGRLVNYLDLAALVIPVGLTATGLPVGLQIVVKRFDDALALRIGRTLERERDGLFKPPPGF